jgi:osmotically-inducible protein OsmY
MANYYQRKKSTKAVSLDIRKGASATEYKVKLDPKEIDDAELIERIQKRLMLLNAEDLKNVTIASDQGVITLAGSVGDTEIANAVRNFADHTIGVRAVKNKIETNV